MDDFKISKTNSRKVKRPKKRKISEKTTYRMQVIYLKGLGFIIMNTYNLTIKR